MYKMKTKVIFKEIVPNVLSSQKQHQVVTTDTLASPLSSWGN